MQNTIVITMSVSLCVHQQYFPGDIQYRLLIKPDFYFENIKLEFRAVRETLYIKNNVLDETLCHMSN